MKFEVIRQIDKLGRICIPIDFRKALGADRDFEIIITMTDDGILLKPYEQKSENTKNNKIKTE